MSSFGFDANDFPSGIKTMETYWNPQEYGQEMSRTCRHWLLLNVNYGFPILSVDIHNILRCWVTHHIPYMVVTQISTWFLVYTSMPFRREKTTCWTEILPLWSIKTELNCDCTDCKKKRHFQFQCVSNLWHPDFTRKKQLSLEIPIFPSWFNGVPQPVFFSGSCRVVKKRWRSSYWVGVSRYGKAWCLWNCIFAPCVLSFWSCAIYCCGCLRFSVRFLTKKNLGEDSESLWISFDGARARCLFLCWWSWWKRPAPTNKGIRGHGVKGVTLGYVFEKMVWYPFRIVEIGLNRFRS